MAVCDVCFRHCEFNEGQTGFCRARICEDGVVRAANYGLITSMALDRIEKKPLNRFMPGSMILSVGSYGCNLRCPFCQNSEISWGREAAMWEDKAQYISPTALAELAASYMPRGNIGMAYTYNEPLIGYEYVRDAAKAVHERGMLNVLVTNGCAGLNVLDEIAPYIDAMNIDLKGYRAAYYGDVIGGDRDMVMRFITEAVKRCHVELTTLIIPGENDTEDEMIDISNWIAGLKDANGQVIGQDIPLHISRFFPRFRMTDRDATDVGLIYHLADIARRTLRYVYCGNC